MLKILSDSHSGANTILCNKNFTYSRTTRSLVCGSGGGGGTFGTSTSTSPAPAGTAPSGFPALTLASIGIFTGTGAITVQGNFTGNAAVRGNYGAGAPDTTSAIANFPARSAVVVLTGAGLSEGTPGGAATATTTGLRGGRLAAEYIAEALNMPVQPAFDTQGLVDMDGQPIILRFGASTDNWQVIGLGPRIATGRDEVGLLVIQNLNTAAAGSANTRPPAGQALLAAEYVQTNTSENPFGNWEGTTGTPDTGEFSVSGTSLLIHPENFDGDSRLAELLSIPAAANLGVTRFNNAQVTRIVAAAGPSFANGIVTIPLTVAHPALVGGAEYSITLTDSEITTGGGGGSVSTTLTEAAGTSLVRHLGSIARSTVVTI